MMVYAASFKQRVLNTLRRRRIHMQEVERHIEEAYLHRRELVKLGVGKITVDRAEEGRAKVDIIYRFGSPEARLGRTVWLVYGTSRRRIRTRSRTPGSGLGVSL